MICPLRPIVGVLRAKWGVDGDMCSDWDVVVLCRGEGKGEGEQGVERLEYAVLTITPVLN
jgi:hypothetical protein